jgi:hypothetical protein
MASSAIVAVRKAVVAAVGNLTAFADLDVMYAYQSTTSREFAYTREATFEHKPASVKSGRNFREEIGEFNFVIWVEAVGGTPADAADRAIALGLPFEEWLADNKNGAALSVTGLNWIIAEGDGSLTEASGDQASYAELVYPIRYHARLT